MATNALVAKDPVRATHNAVSFMVDEDVIARYEKWAEHRKESAPDLMRIALEHVIQQLESGQILVHVFETGNVQQAVMISAANIAERYKAFASGIGHPNECDLMRYALDIWHPPAN